MLMVCHGTESAVRPHRPGRWRHDTIYRGTPTQIMTTRLFPFAEYWWFYAAFGILILLLLVMDLAAHRTSRPISTRAAARWTGLWVLLGMGFSGVIYLLAANRYGPGVARQMSFEYLAGYLVEESLSIDNMFVFALVFRYFSLGGEQQHRVLFYGILGAMVSRGIFVAAGSALIQFHWVVIAFGAFLVLSGLRMAFASEQRVEPERNLVIRIARRFVPVSSELRGHRFIVREGGSICFTPLMIILLVLESTDIVFAVDSVPAVFGVTKEPLIVYTSNVFAVLGLRAMYFLLSGALDRFHLLKYGLSVVLVFVGLKMAVFDNLAGGRLPIGFSLAVIATTVIGAIALSLLFPRISSGALNHRAARVGRIVIGSVSTALCCANLVMAAGVRPSFLENGGLEAIRTEWLYVSGLCYALCGWLLLRPKRS
jgi:tellurite resistance protein TerC